MLKAVEALAASGKTVVILTHELEKTLALADRLVILDKGSIRDDGKPDEVLSRGIERFGVRDPRRAYLDVRDCSWLG